MRDARGEGSSFVNNVRGVWATLNYDTRARMEADAREHGGELAVAEFNVPIGAGLRGAARLTTKQAADLAAWLGYGKRVRDVPFNSMGQAVFTNGKDFITLDVTMHSGVQATWKLFSTAGQRLGTFNFDLSVLIGK